MLASLVEVDGLLVQDHPWRVDWRTKSLDSRPTMLAEAKDMLETGLREAERAVLG